MTTSSTLPDLESLSASDLEALVAHHNKLYWDLNAPVLSDYEYDRLVTRLKSVAPSSPALVAMGPSTRLGAEIRHSEAMLSLDKCYSAEELKDWVDSFEGDVVAMPKIDGVACTLHYDANGNLKQAATRGDGVVGDDITQNALQIADIPRKLPLNRAVEVRGEVFMKLSVFQRFKAEGMANPRNLAAGAINQKDAKKSAGYGLSFFGYELLGAGHETQAAQLAHLKELKFAPMITLCCPKNAPWKGMTNFPPRVQPLTMKLTALCTRPTVLRSRSGWVKRRIIRGTLWPSSSRVTPGRPHCGRWNGPWHAPAR